jgi:hypothetical protein
MVLTRRLAYGSGIEKGIYPNNQHFHEKKRFFLAAGLVRHASGRDRP